jgi:hypothetical protein
VWAIRVVDDDELDVMNIQRARGELAAIGGAS